ncbi:MAG: DUF2232 domain-containing protein [Coriobacteriia bacterium]|nr:DUF2232 domain-containing protein [Coriobacteriia bacterium]
MARAAGNSPAAPASGRTLLSMLSVVGGALLVVLVHPMVGLPIAAGALVTMVFRRQPVAAVIAAVAGGIAATVLASLSTYVVFVPLMGIPVTARAPYVHAAWITASLLVAGFLTPWLLRRFKALPVTAVIAFVLSVVEVAALASLASGAGMGLAAYVMAGAREMIALVGMADEYGELFATGWTAMLVAMNMLAALFVVVMAGVSGSRLDPQVQVFPALADVDLDPRTALLAIVTVALLAVGRLTATSVPVIEQLGMNLLVVARMVFLLQGLAVFAGLYRRANVSRPVRVLGFALLGATEMMIPAVSLTGLADIWLNLRRLPRDGADPAAPSGPSGIE